MAFLALSWRVWVLIGLLFLYALLRRLLAHWLDRRRADRAPPPFSSQSTAPGRVRLGREHGGAGVIPSRIVGDAEPASNVRKIDATVERDLARSLQVRSAPTAVLADRDGAVRTRLVGVDAVSDYLEGVT